MKKILICFLAAAAALSSTALSYCAEKETADMKTIEGEVVLADSTQSVLTVKWLKNAGDPERREKTFLISEDTNITKGGAPIGLADVKAGNLVIIEYEESTEGVTVRSIAVKESPQEAETEGAL